MKLRLDILALAVCAAVGLHLAAALATKSLPLVGSGRLGRAAGEMLDDPELAAVSRRDPVRVVLGSAERGTVSTPGPRAVLDPLNVRRPPDLGAEWPDVGPRLEAARGIFAPPPELAREGAHPLRIARPGGGVPSSRAWADYEMVDAAIPLGAKVVMRRLPGRFRAPPTLAAALEARDGAARPVLAPRKEQLDFPVPLALPPSSGEGRLPGPDEARRPITPPEIFVDVLEIGRKRP